VNVVAPRQLTYAELEAALPLLLAAPKERGVLEMIVRRPALNEREVIDGGELRAGGGLVATVGRPRARASRSR
jgi:hypothetical protein